MVLECDFGELTLLPIAGTETRLLMPFRLNKGTETLKGELVLGDRDPLPLLIGEAVADEDAITAWTCALLGFADATCIEFEPVEPTARRESARPRGVRPPRCPSIAPRCGPCREGSRGRGTSSRLATGSATAARSLPATAAPYEGQTASAEARDRARQVGIILHPHETWVRPHTRGIPDGIEMRFLWHAPTELKLSHTSP